MSQIPLPNLGSIITSAKLRKGIYAGYGLVALAVTAIQVGFAAADSGQPLWLNVTIAVVLFLGIPISGLAAANAPTGAPPQGD